MFSDIYEEYNELLNGDIMNDVDERLLAIEKLTDPEKYLLFLYAELGSLRKVGDILNCSHQSVQKRLNKIRKKCWG